MTKKKHSKYYLEFLDEELQDPEFALGYLNLALEEYDPKTFLVVLGDLVRARGGSVTEVAKRAGLSREGLHRMLSMRGNPAFSSVLAVMDALDFQINIRPTQQKKGRCVVAAKKTMQRPTGAHARRRSTRSPRSPPPR